MLDQLFQAIGRQLDAHTPGKTSQLLASLCCGGSGGGWPRGLLGQLQMGRKAITDFYSRTWRHRYRRKFATILGWCPATFLDRIKLRTGRARRSPTDVITNTPARENNISGWNGERRDKLSMGFDNFVG